MSIKNVVFDFGQVMVHFEPSYMVGKYVEDKEDAALLEKVVFDRLYWDKLDAGTITGEKTLEECRKRLPERLWDVADTIFYNWIYNIPEIDGMADLVSYVKNTYGVKILLLSNISHYFADHANEISCLSDFDGFVFSARIGIVKPSREIFEYLCNSFGILPSETVFVDDNKDNINGANQFGINGYLFDGDVPKLKAYLDEILKK
ncbi:MAG: HAD family phosphatase [Clostridia bacterium]|nr:HAD family phosphatase [Clostridia bacterium]